MMTKLEKMANEWQQEELKKRPLQPFEDYYKTIRAYEAGFKAARSTAIKRHDCTAARCCYDDFDRYEHE